MYEPYDLKNPPLVTLKAQEATDCILVLIVPGLVAIGFGLLTAFC